MVLRNTKVLISDNSGIRTVKCIGMFGSSKHAVAYSGERIRVSVKKKNPLVYKRFKYVKDMLYQSILITDSKTLGRKDGTTVCFEENRGLIIDNNLKFAGRDIYGPIDRQFYKYKLKPKRRQKKQITTFTKYRDIFKYSNYFI